MSQTWQYCDHLHVVNSGWQRQAESSELADGGAQFERAIGKLALAAATHDFGVVGVLPDLKGVKK